MNRLTALLMTVLLLTSTVTLADSEADKQAEQLFNVIGLEATFDQAMKQMVNVQLQQNPGLEPYKDILLQFFEKYTGYDSVKAELIKAYTEAFTVSELKELTTFYGSDLGQKALRKMPELMGQAAQNGVARVQANMGELQGLIKKESERLEALQKAGDQ